MVVVRLCAGTEVGLMGLWDLGLSPMNPEVVLGNLKQQAADANLAVVATESIGTFDLRVFVDEGLDDWARACMSLEVAPFLLHVATGELCWGGLEQYRCRGNAPIASAQRVSIPPGDYEVMWYVPTIEESEQASSSVEPWPSDSMGGRWYFPWRSFGARTLLLLGVGSLIFAIDWDQVLLGFALLANFVHLATITERHAVRAAKELAMTESEPSKSIKASVQIQREWEERDRTATEPSVVGFACELRRLPDGETRDTGGWINHDGRRR